MDTFEERQESYALQLQHVPSIKAAIDRAAANNSKSVTLTMRLLWRYPLRMYAAVAYSVGLGLRVEITDTAHKKAEPSR